ncbi:MAG: FAD-binding oxidoreductase [Pseudomonadota bacterium]
MSFLFANDEMGRYPPSWYADSTEKPQPRKHLSGRAKADICIIGAGYTGLSAALHLAQSGLNVIVLEAHRTGFGASGRNGGQVGTGLNWPQSKLERKLGKDTARQIWAMTEEAKSLVHALATEHAPTAGIAPGVAHMDFTRADRKTAAIEADYMAATYGYDKIEPLDTKAAQDIVKTSRYAGGQIDWGAWHLHPLRYAVGLADAAETAGAVIHENSWVTHITEGSPNVVYTEKGRVEAEWVIHATNGYTTTLNRTQSAGVMPINNYLVATAPLDDPQAVLAKNIAVADNRFVLNYYRMSDDGRLIFGGGESYGKKFPTDIFKKVRKPLQNLFPQLADVELTHAWGGTLGITQTRLPMIGMVGKTQLAACGYSGHGVAMATFAGKLMAEALTMNTDRFDVLSKLPTPAFPGGRALRSPIMTLAMTWFALRDRLEI